MAYNLKPSYSSVDELNSRDRAISILYGRQADALGGNIVPINVDAGGNLILGTGMTLSASDIDIGDVVIKGVTNPALQGTTYTPGEERIGLIRVGDASAPNASLYEVLVRDPRLTFTGNSLQVTGGNNAIAAQTISIVAPTFTAFASTGISPLLVAGYRDKSFVVTNTGANSVTVRAYVSMDNGAAYDTPILVPSALAPGAHLWMDDARAFTGVRFEFQRGAGDTTVVIKGYAQ